MGSEMCIRDRGNCSNESLGDKISVTLIASGFDKARKTLQNQSASPHIVSLDDDKSPESRGLSNADSQTSMFGQTKNDPYPAPENYNNSRHAEPYIDEPHKHEPTRRQLHDEPVSRTNYRSQVANVRLSNPQTVVELENTPAYIRRKVVLEDVPHSSEQGYSKWSISQDDELIMRNDNPFLRDLAD